MLLWPLVRRGAGGPWVSTLEATQLMNREDALVIDVRDADAYAKGHILGAKSIPFNSMNDETAKLKSAEEIRAIFSKAGVQPGDTIVAYCHVGQQATAVLFAARTLGHPVLLYDGSFDDWNKRTELPVVKP